MELTLARREGDTLVTVTCDGVFSHTFDLPPLLLGEAPPGYLPARLLDPQAYGRQLFAALFAAGSAARQALEAWPPGTGRLLFVTEDAQVQRVPWEYTCGPRGYLAADYPFVRGLPPAQRRPAPALAEGLHIVAVPSNPLDPTVPPLDIEGEWLRLREEVEKIDGALVLERTRPPTLFALRQLVAQRQNRVVHFMGHGGAFQGEAVLLFENDIGAAAPVTAQDFERRVRGTVFLVTLNACISARPGATPFGNLAAALVRQGTPYALGMQMAIVDGDARTFSRTFYSELARGSPVEQALLQARLELAGSPQPWAVGVPVLYTTLQAPAAGFPPQAGKARIEEHQPPLQLDALPRAAGAFQGRVPELLALGQRLTGDSRPRLLTIHGSGGQGKTALAREAAERFAHAWHSGAWGISLETLPSRAQLVHNLARFLGIATEQMADPGAVERQVIGRLAGPRTLLVLDNAETLVQAVDAGNADAIALAGFLRDSLAGSRATLLVTSRDYLGWPGEQGLDLEGLQAEDGARLFTQSAPQRAGEVEMALAAGLSRRVEGHPLSLRLLGGAFNARDIPLADFTQQYEAELLQAQDRYKAEDHRHRTLYAAIDTSVRTLAPELRALLSGLWLFHAPFLAEMAAAIFDPDGEYPASVQSPVYDYLHTLWQRSLLARSEHTVRDGTVRLYRLLPTVRPYTEYYMEQVVDREELLARFGTACARLVSLIYDELDRSAALVYVAQQARDDLARGLAWVAAEQRGYYLLHWGWVVGRLGDTRQALDLVERALEQAQGRDQRLELEALNNMALVYRATGQPQRALALYEQALMIMREVGNRAGEASTLSNMAVVYRATGQPQRALALYEQALPVRREVGDRAGEASTLSNMAVVYRTTGQPQQALELFQQTLPIMREVRDRAGEASTLNNMALVYFSTGQPQQALALYKQALPIMREVGNRAGEATTLNNMAGVYDSTGQLQRALALYEQALPIRREVGDRAGEAATLNNMASVYRVTGQPQRALELYVQALVIVREVENRAGEAATLNNMALVCESTGQPQQALALYEEVLPITREVRDRAGEAATLNNMAGVYNSTGEPQRALALYEEALLIRREVRDRAGEAVTLNNMAGVYESTGQPQRALVLYEEVLPIRQEVEDRAGEAVTLDNMSNLLWSINRAGEAIAYKAQSVALLEQGGLSYNGGGIPLAQIKAELAQMQSSAVSPDTAGDGGHHPG
ncbi:MAG: tetratricopeptide repeat protein [Chloroflexi bacterium]|nr:tetratricopeptide repeat protein [Chloroflexota bacterium]